MDVDGPAEFLDWLDRTEDKARNGDEPARRLLARAVDALNQLRTLEQAPTEDMPDLKQVRQSKNYPVWRTAHPFDPAIAFRLICWFPHTAPPSSLHSSPPTRPTWLHETQEDDNE